ncbi:cyclic nucleotide-binding protein [Legionella wadsworthii]|uniref:Cyclic nucleotide-binding protein n=1 Tax=Legionella wadsworthii TaxID=28088 RepID=A0A378M1U9_9GAMM|nr:cyclic nucleotide-binding domain-containing protein [Legionella wadsworthii]STY30740.1 cyclic nucleotide-binding protein [Legionella wadsworthii]
MSSQHLEQYILNHPLFCLLDNKSAHQLMECAQPECIQAGHFAVVDGDPIDSISLIVSGKAEVIRTVYTMAKHREMRIAELKEGNIIGLSSEGFASSTGLHTNSVRALTEMQLYKITLYDFLQFLKDPNIRYPYLKKLSEEFLLIQFIRAHHTFQTFSHEKIQTMVKTARNVKIPAGTFLYRKGDEADTCYYLLNGAIHLDHSKENSPTSVGVNQMFGCSEFLSNKKRNESAYAMCDSEVLVMEAKVVNEMFKVEGYPSLLQRVTSQFKKNK